MTTKSNKSSAAVVPEKLRQATNRIKDLVGTELQKDGALSPLGNRANAMNGRVDMAILNGVTSLSELIAFVGNPATRKSDPEDVGKAARRIKDHIHWMATNSKAYNGFEHSIARVSKGPKTLVKKLTTPLRVIDTCIQQQYKEKFTANGKVKEQQEAKAA